MMLIANLCQCDKNIRNFIVEQEQAEYLCEYLCVGPTYLLVVNQVLYF